MDFVAYHRSLGRHIILVCRSEDYEDAKRACGESSPADRTLREGEPPYLVHSTTPEGCTGILRDGCIKCWNLLKKEQTITETHPIGQLLGDPADTCDYIMLGGGVHPELVVLSRQRNALCMDTKAEYMPGSRFYFDTAQLARCSLLVRDGLHFKVKDRLSLDFALFRAHVGNTGLQGSRITPELFSKAADAAFEKHCGVSLK